jgi:hypothetical protein
VTLRAEWSLMQVAFVLLPRYVSILSDTENQLRLQIDLSSRFSRARRTKCFGGPPTKKHVHKIETMRIVLSRLVNIHIGSWRNITCSYETPNGMMPCVITQAFETLIFCGLFDYSPSLSSFGTWERRDNFPEETLRLSWLVALRRTWLARQKDQPKKGMVPGPVLT